MGMERFGPSTLQRALCSVAAKRSGGLTHWTGPEVNVSLSVRCPGECGAG